jgi:hypothetical protein
MADYLAIYQNVDELLAAADKGWNAGRKYRECRDGGSSWVGRKFTGGWQGVKDAVSGLWEEGLDVVQQMIYEIDRERHTLPAPKDRRRRRRFSEDNGDDVDHDRLRSGQGDFWSETKRTRVAGPQFITLIVNTATFSYRKADEILWRGAVAICLADLLEKEGYRVEVWAVDYCERMYSYDDRSLQATRVKEASVPLDIPSITNTVSGWFYRTVRFQALERDRTPLSGYGSPRDISADSFGVKELVGNNSTPVIIDGVWSLNEALAKVREIINSLNSEEVGA